MTVSEVIEEFIRRNPQLALEPDAFESFLHVDRIRAWVGADGSRRERLRREFSRVWADMHPVVVSKGQALEPPRARPAPPPPAPRAAPRKLHLLCAACSRMDVWSVEGRVECRHCGRAYDDLLDLVPVKPVGPFAYLFGEGAAGWLTAAGVAAGLAGLYLALRWLRWG